MISLAAGSCPIVRSRYEYEALETCAIGLGLRGTCAECGHDLAGLIQILAAQPLHPQSSVAHAHVTPRHSGIGCRRTRERPLELSSYAQCTSRMVTCCR